MRWVWIWVFVLGSVGLGQTAAPRAAFEVVSIRQAKTDTMSNFSPMAGARIHEVGMSLKVLIQLAYDLEGDEVSGPEWIGSQLYDLDATTEGGVALTREQMKPLLRTMLAERFKLTYHRESKQVSGYVMVVGSKGAKLEESKGAEGASYIVRDGMVLRNAPLKMLAAALRNPVGQRVVDQTGILGNYTIDLKYAPAGAEDSTLPTIFTAVQEQLGLKLEARKLPVEMLVVDHAEKVPTEN